MMKVLIVDDHVLFRDGLVGLLRSEPDFDVVGFAGSVSQAVEIATQTQPDLVLMDFSLPDGTGVEATQAIHAELPDCKVVFLTVYDTDEKLFAALRQGAAGYLLKNLSIQDLLSSLRALQHGEAAISRSMTARVLAKFADIGNLSEPEPSEVLKELTPRELVVLHELVKGATNREIAVNLYISIHTVKRHINSILSKLCLPDRHAAGQFARRCGIR
jgi:DNA-binding NarL/FixJ family response regulator